MRKRNASSRFAVKLALAATFGAVLFAYRPVSFAPSDGPSRVTGRAAVIDGDTIDIGGRRVRLYGIDAPEGAQICRDGRGRDYACGRMARGALADRIERRTLVCEPRDVDRHDRIVATCRAGGEDVAEWLVRQGWAAADGAYDRSEAEAKAERLGVWAGEPAPRRDGRER